MASVSALLTSRRLVAAAVAAGAGVVAFSGPVAFSHCQVPCGIYDDKARFNKMLEDTTTIKKAMVQIKGLSATATSSDAAAAAQSLNQVTRWVNTKEAHASAIMETISEYFLTQKLKPVSKGDPGYAAYLEKLAAHHAVLRHAMVAKQNVDHGVAQTLEDSIKALWTALDDHKH